MRLPSLLVAVLAAVAIDSTADTFAVRGGVIIGSWYQPYGTAFGYPYPFLYDSFGPCLAPGYCQDDYRLRRFLDRYERNHGRSLAADPPPVVFPTLPRNVAPTPEAHIQPRYREASQIRPEFEGAGQELGARRDSGK